MRCRSAPSRQARSMHYTCGFASRLLNVRQDNIVPNSPKFTMTVLAYQLSVQQNFEPLLLDSAFQSVCDTTSEINSIPTVAMVTQVLHHEYATTCMFGVCQDAEWIPGLDFQACTADCCLHKQQQDMQQTVVITGQVTGASDPECCCQLHTSLLVS